MRCSDNKQQRSGAAKTLLNSQSNVGLPWYMLVTAAVFQPTMLPYVAAAVVGLFTQASAAKAMFESVMAVCACVPGAKRSAVTATAAQRRHGLCCPEAVIRQNPSAPASQKTLTTVQTTCTVTRQAHASRRHS